MESMVGQRMTKGTIFTSRRYDRVTIQTKLTIGDRVKVIALAEDLPEQAARFTRQTGEIVDIINNYYRVKFKFSNKFSSVAAYIASELTKVE